MIGGFLAPEALRGALGRFRGGSGCGVPPGWLCCAATRSASPQSRSCPTLEPSPCCLLGCSVIRPWVQVGTHSTPRTPTPRPARPEITREGPREGTGQAESLVLSLRVQRAAPRSCRFTAGLGPQCSGQRDVTRRRAEFPVGPVWQALAGHKRRIPLAVVLPPPARGAGTLIPSAQRLVWAAKQPLGKAALGALFA